MYDNGKWLVTHSYQLLSIEDQHLVWHSQHSLIQSLLCEWVLSNEGGDPHCYGIQNEQADCQTRPYHWVIPDERMRVANPHCYGIHNNWALSNKSSPLSNSGELVLSKLIWVATLTIEQLNKQVLSNQVLILTIKWFRRNYSCQTKVVILTTKWFRTSRSILWGWWRSLLNDWVLSNQVLMLTTKWLILNKQVFKGGNHEAIEWVCVAYS